MGVQVTQRHVEVPQVQHVQVPMIQEVDRHVHVPQVEVVDNHVHIPVHKHRHVPMVTISQRHVDVPVIETVERIVDVPHITMVDKHVEVPHHQVVEKIVEIPMVGDEIQGMVNHSHDHLPVERQQHPAEVFHHHEVGMPFDTHYAGVQGAPVTYAAPAATQGGSMFQPMGGSTFMPGSAYGGSLIQ